MKEASKVLYVVGKVFNIIAIVAQALGILGGYYASTNSQILYDKLVEAGVSEIPVPEGIKHAGFVVLSSCIFGLALAIVMIVFATKAKKAVDENRKANKLHITMIVLGAFENIFYLLAGIFGIVGWNKEPDSETKQETVIEEKGEQK